MSLQSLLQDVRYAVRVLRLNPGFTAVAAITLALAIGASTAVFSIVHAVLLRGLPYPQPDRLVEIWTATGEGDGTAFSAPEFEDLRRETRSFAAVAAYREDVFDLSGAGETPEWLQGAQVTPEFFDVFRTAAVHGRVFGRADADRSERLAVISEVLWRRRFGADPAVAGRTIRLSGEPFTIAGVAPARFGLPPERDVWVLPAGGIPTSPLSAYPDPMAVRELQYLEVVGRLKAGTSVGEAAGELEAFAASLARRHPTVHQGQSFRLASLRDRLVGDVRPALLVLFGAVGCVLLIACANVAGLLLARGAGRRREVGIRAALGAGRGRLVRQLVTESLLLALLGGALGVALAAWATDALLALAPADLPRADEIRMSPAVAAFGLVLALVTGAAFGAAPALQLSRGGLLSALQEGSRGSAGGRSRRSARTYLTVGQVALAVVLIVAAGLLVSSLLRLSAVDPGFRPERLVSVQLPLAQARYPDPAGQASVYAQVIERLRGSAGVTSVGAIFPAPLAGGGDASGSVQIEGRPKPPSGEDPIVSFAVVSPGTFAALGAPLLRGRDIADSDTETSGNVAVVNRAMALRFWPGEDPVGRRVNLGDEADPTWFTVVGVVGDVRSQSLAAEPEPMLFIPYRQFTLPFLNVLVRSPLSAERVASLVGAEVRQVDPLLPVGEVHSYQTVVSRSLGEPRFRAVLLAAFAALALLLAALGVYGVLSELVGQREREIGVRVALGADQRSVSWMVLHEAGRLVGVGLLVGSLGALALATTLRGLLYGVSPADPSTFGALVAVVAAAALAASWLPARRAARVEPLVALRTE